MNPDQSTNTHHHGVSGSREKRLERAEAIGSIFLFLVAMLLIPGLVFLYTGYRNWDLASRISQWNAVEGGITRIQYSERRGGGDLSYTYEYGVEQYSKTEFLSMSPGEGRRYVDRIHGANSYAQVFGQSPAGGPGKHAIPIPVTLNPLDPNEATVQPEYYSLNYSENLTTGALLVGFGLLIIVTKSLLVARLMPPEPGRPPWIAETRWRSFKLFPHDPHSWGFMVAGLVFCGCVSWFFGTRLRTMPGAPFWIVPAAVVPGVFCLTIMFAMASSIIRKFRLGKPRILLQKLPIVIGETFEGTFEAEGKFPSDHSCRFVLSCRKGGMDHPPGPGEIIHESAVPITQDLAKPEEGGIRLMFRILIPENRPGRCSSGSQQVFWVLEAEWGGGDVSYKAAFDLPVYPVNDPGQVITLDSLRRKPS